MKQIKVREKVTSITLIAPHVTRKSNTKIRKLNKSVIIYSDWKRETIVAVINFVPFSTMSHKLKGNYQKLSHHLIAQSTFQNPNKINGPAKIPTNKG